MTIKTSVKPEYKDLDVDALTDIIKQLVKQELRVADDTDDNEIDTHIGAPSESQFKTIQSLTNTDTSSEDWVVVPFCASNNLVDLGYRRWHLNVLKQMSQDFVGRPHILDHDWYDSEYAVAFIFDAKLIKDSECPDDVLNMGGFGDYNKDIVEDEGYVWLYLNVAIAKSHDAAEAIMSRRYNDCSTGSILTKPKMICPNCTKHYGREIGFYDLNAKGDDYICPHLIPSRWMFWLYDDNPDVQFADYVILDAVHHEAVELSSCIRGALPAASVCRK